MFSSIRDIDPLWLRKNHERIYFFGLGFVQVKINERFRLHFYAPELPPFVESPHDHRYNFVSRVLSGSIKNVTYDLLPGDTWEVRKESCRPGIKAAEQEPFLMSCDLKIRNVQFVRAGEEYFMPHQLFHTVRSQGCVTLLDRGPYEKEFAFVASRKGEIAPCPFSGNIPEERLWEIIERMLGGK